MLQHQPEDLVVTVDAGTRLGELNRDLASSGQWVPIDASLEDDTVGGMVGAGLDAVYRARYGSLRDRALAIRVWTPRFGTIGTGARVVKNVAGYALGRLFWGSRGAFGVVTQVTLKVAPRPEAVAGWQLGDGPSPFHLVTDATTGPWAYQVSVKRSGQFQHFVQWHGSPAMIADWEAMLGPADSFADPALSPHLPYHVTGASTVVGARSLLLAASSAVEILVERQSGWFTAASDDREAIQAFAASAAEKGAVVASLTGLPVLTRPFPETLVSVYRRLRHEYDPESILFDPWIEDDGG